jgi:aspartate/methionine/tyrosine aminotransferase
VRYDFTETGVHPLFLHELISREELDEIHQTVQLRYIQTNGTEPLKNSISELYEDVDQENILVTNGSAEANLVAVWSLIEPGDDVVLVLPNYMQVPGIARAFGGETKIVYLSEKTGWTLDIDELEGAVTGKTKLVYLSNPNNPTGAILSRDEMEGIVEVADRAGAWLLADEVYRGAELDGAHTPSFWGTYPKALVVSGLSKAYTLPGLRIGWLIGPPEFVEECWGVHDYTTITTNALSERLALVAMREDTRRKILKRNREISRKNLAVLQKWIATHPETLRFVNPRIGGVAFVGYELNIGSTVLATKLLEEHSVLVVPGDAFGTDGFFRIGYGSPRLNEGLALMDETIKALQER